jgi:hypothetical protein
MDEELPPAHDETHEEWELKSRMRHLDGLLSDTLSELDTLSTEALREKLEKIHSSVMDSLSRLEDLGK